METSGRHAGTSFDSDLLAAAVQALNSGSYGFVYLCKDLRTGELVAIKFIERGEKVTKASCTPCCLRRSGGGRLSYCRMAQEVQPWLPAALLAAAAAGRSLLRVQFLHVP